MSKFLCYDEDNGSEGEARMFEDTHASYAAEVFAEEQCNRGSFEGDTMDVMVKADGESKWRRFTVDKEIDVAFHATEDL